MARMFADNIAVYKASLSNLDLTQSQQGFPPLAEWEKRCTWPSILQSVPGCLSQETGKYLTLSTMLTTVMSAKYLSITIHKEARWDSHADTVTVKANMTLWVPQSGTTSKSNHETETTEGGNVPGLCKSCT